MLALPPSPAAAADCPGNPAALGTARVLAIDPAQTAPVGRKQFPQTLPLEPKEVVLTFDDGPSPGTTDRVLAALTTRMRARNLLHARPQRRRASGDWPSASSPRATPSAHHSYRHPLLNRMSLERAEAEIDHGIAAVEAAVYGEPGGPPRTPFFRFPGFACEPGAAGAAQGARHRGVRRRSLAGRLEPMTPEHERALLLKRLTAAGGGIVLLHDTQAKTAAMLPELLRELKRRDYRIVHIVPARR